MSDALKPLVGDQARGAVPSLNAWLSASAGTGKTQVLTARVLRLLLSGAAPESILCITFTKAGASEMARRIRERLAAWVRMTDAQLRKDLFAIQPGEHDDADVLRHARTLFARVIDAPGRGLAIQTIHSFCQSLLSSFPEEAGLAPGFRALEDREIALLRREVLTGLIDDAVRSDPRLIERLQAMSLKMDETMVAAFLNRCVSATRALDALPAVIAPWLRGEFGFPAEVAPKDWLERHCVDDALDVEAIRAISAANAAWGTATGMARADICARWLALSPAGRAEALDDLLLTMLTAKGELRSDYNPGKRLGDVGDLATRLSQALATLAATARGMAAADRMADALEVGRAFARAFAMRKRREGVVDFDDLVKIAVTLLADEGRSAWIRYKLDARIDHILVDEAQDTNPEQWAIVRSLAEEFFAGEGARDSALRTLFVVGDYKQAIYGFQGTNPLYFNAARKMFALMGKAGERPFADLSIDTNFRSSPPVLRVVDGVIARLGPEALGLDGDVVRHSAFADAAPGRVVLWPLEPADAGENGDEDAGEAGWIDSATRRVADRIARTVRGWLDDGIDGEPVRAADVMVLVRKRGDIARLIVSRLQSHGVPVAGVDRLRLHAPIAVQDLLAAARFVLQPLDDLNLANLLVSPLMGWTHDDLIAHGWREPRAPLWPHLRAQPELAERIAPLTDLLGTAGFATPHRFLEHILSGPMRGRAKLLARLGNAALDPVEELVSQALAFETREGASLHRFLQWFDMGDLEIKREVDTDSDEVRVMTVHGAKGLQARIVILADAAGDPWKGLPADLSLDCDAGRVPLPRVAKEEQPERMVELARLADGEGMQEHWRLLYVAMTRAERMLFVAGAQPRKGELSEHSWYAAIRPAVEELGGEWADSDCPWGSALTYAVAGREPSRGGETRDRDAPRPALPGWATSPAPVEARPPRPLAPSAAGAEDALAVPAVPPSAAARLAAERGSLMHALFERLPPVAPERRAEAARRWLDRAAGHLEISERKEMAASVLTVLDDPAHAAIFAPGSLAETPFSAIVADRVIAGVADRLVVDDTSVRVIDFKTGAVPPGPGAVPAGYLRQMAAYVAALEVIFPGRRVDAALLFTAGPLLVDLPPAVLAAHKPGLAEDKVI